MKKRKLRINFVLPSSPKITGGPLAILEYANRFIAKGHDVSITTYPDKAWLGDSPFPWFDFKGKLIYKKLGGTSEKHAITDSKWKVILKAFKFFIKNSEYIAKLRNYKMKFKADLRAKEYNFIISELLRRGDITDLTDLFLSIGGNINDYISLNIHSLLTDVIYLTYVMDVMPECDLNIATFWSTAFPVYYSRKGKPVYFMQHYEEVFYPNDIRFMIFKLGVRMSYCLPIYKIANSSWLKSVILEKYGQDVPFSNNGIVVEDFNPMKKKSENDGIVRVVTYSKPDEWKGFGDAAAAMRVIKEKYQDKVEWNVFGYLNHVLPPGNEFIKYTYHKDLSFKKLAELYATSDIALCPSWYESFPLPPLESMASGTAVITTAFGTEDYAFNEKNSLVIKSRDIKGMVSALEKLILNKNIREQLAQEGRKTAEYFTWETAVNNRERILLDIYTNNTAYDIFRSSKLGFRDGYDLEFERAPIDIKFDDFTMIKAKNGFMVYLIENNTKRHIVEARVVDELGLDWNKMIEIDDLTLFRIPNGSPIFNASDIIGKPTNKI